MSLECLAALKYGAGINECKSCLSSFALIFTGSRRISKQAIRKHTGESVDNLSSAHDEGRRDEEIVGKEEVEKNLHPSLGKEVTQWRI